MNPDRREELVNKIKLGSEIKPPRRCARCRDLLKHEEASEFCEKCDHANRTEVSQAALREKVLARDHGICANCLTNCVELRNQLDEMLEHDRESASAKIDLWRRGFLKGFPRAVLLTGQALWQADHVNPSVKGGPTTLENGRTLCIPCHKEVTGDLARERKEKRGFGRG